jgi:hypothetical protein
MITNQRAATSYYEVIRSYEHITNIRVRATGEHVHTLYTKYEHTYRR